MNGEEIATAAAKAVGGLSEGFMSDPATYAHGAEQGYKGIDFYFVGRAGVLGDVDADVVAAALVFFNPDVVHKAWASSAAVLPRLEAAAAWAACGARWADRHLGDDLDWARLDELAAKVVDEASPSGAPIFAGLRRLAVPSDPKQAALHRCNCLRELRMARHGAAVIATGLDVADAVRHRSPHMLGIYGWEDRPVDPGFAERWEEAERLTNVASARDYEVLDDAEAEDFVKLADAALAAVSKARS
ncbi:MAG TPA: hypothetical protein VIL36_07605 [Acidimicrobiales bacterium]